MIAEYAGSNHLTFKSIMANTGFCIDCEKDVELNEQGLCIICKSSSTIPHGSVEGLKYNLEKGKKK